MKKGSKSKCEKYGFKHSWVNSGIGKYDDVPLNKAVDEYLEKKEMSVDFDGGIKLCANCGLLMEYLEISYREAKVFYSDGRIENA